MTDRKELDALLAISKAKVAAMTSEQKEDMLRKQAKSWARGEMAWPKPKFKMVNGVKVCDSYEDYCNG